MSTRTLKDKAHVFFGQHRSKLQTAVETASLFSTILPRGGVAAKVAGAIYAVNAVANEMFPYSYRIPNEWQQVRISTFSTAMAHMIDRQVPEKVEKITAELTLKTFDIFGVPLFVVTEKKSTPQMFTLKDLSDKEIYRSFGRAITEGMGDHVLAGYNSKKDFHDISTDPLMSDVRGSKLSREWTEALKLYRDAGISRAMLFYGPSGTGKTMACRHIAKSLGGLTLRVPASLLTNTNAIKALLEMLRPSVLLVDDICNVSTSGLVDVFEDLKSNVDVILCTANFAHRIHPALLRAQRFDELVEVKSLDREVTDRMFEGIPAEARELLKECPIAYIDAFRIRCKVEGADKALKGIRDLVARAETISKLSGTSIKLTASHSEVLDVEMETSENMYNAYDAEVQDLEKGDDDMFVEGGWVMSSTYDYDRELASEEGYIDPGDEEHPSEGCGEDGYIGSTPQQRVTSGNPPVIWPDD